MAQLINTYIEDAKQGMYVSYPDKNEVGVNEMYAPRYYQKAKKVVTYCYDDGSIEQKGIGEDVYDENEFFRGAKMIGRVHKYVDFFDTIRAFNLDLIEVDVADILEDIESNRFAIDKEYFSTWFKELIAYLKTWDIRQEPQPWCNIGFKYYYVDGEEPYYEIAGITTNEEHGIWRGSRS